MSVFTIGCATGGSPYAQSPVEQGGKKKPQLITADQVDAAIANQAGQTGNRNVTASDAQRRADSLTWAAKYDSAVLAEKTTPPMLALPEPTVAQNPTISNTSNTSNTSTSTPAGSTGAASGTVTTTTGSSGPEGTTVTTTVQNLQPSPSSPSKIGSPVSNTSTMVAGNGVKVETKIDANNSVNGNPKTTTTVTPLASNVSNVSTSTSSTITANNPVSISSPTRSQTQVPVMQASTANTSVQIIPTVSTLQAPTLTRPMRRDSVITLTTLKRPGERPEGITKVSYREVPVDAPSQEKQRVRGSEGAWIEAGPDAPRVNVSFYQDEIADVLTLFAEVGKVSIISSDEQEVQSKKITAEIKDKPWNLALELLLRSQGLRANQDAVSGIITVQSERRSSGLRQPEIIRLRYVDADDIIPTLQAIIGGSSGAAGGVGGGFGGQTGSVIGGGGMGGAGGLGGGMTAEGDVINAVKNGAAKSRTLMVYTSPEKLIKVKQMVAKVDRQRPTVTIQARMVFINRSLINRYGFNYSIVPQTSSAAVGGSVTPTPGNSGVSGTSGGAAFSLLTNLALNKRTNLSIFFEALRSVGLAEVEAAPLITTTSDLQANINVGEFFILPNPTNILAGTNVVVPGQTGGQTGGQPGQTGGTQPGGQTGATQGGGSPFSTFSTGTVMKVTPYALSNGKIRMAIEISREQGNLDPTKGTITGPSQRAQTEVITNDNEMIVIGGLSVIQRTSQKGGVPILSDLPLVGGLFKSQNTENQLMQDLVIVIQPKIINADDEDVNLDDPPPSQE